MSRILSALVLSAILNACVGPFAARPLGASAYDLHVDNGTTLDVSVIADGRPVGVAPAGQGLTVASGTLPNGEYLVEVTTPSGRTLSRGKVYPGDVSRTESSSRGSGFRQDLSCGRVDVWVGVPMIGPAPGPGNPGDCDP